jgi:hypothetical protein
MNWLEAILSFLTQLLPVIQKAILPDAIRTGKFDISKPRLSQDERIKAYDKEYRRLVNHTEINISDDVAFVEYNLTDAERAQLISLLQARIYEHRAQCVKISPILYPRFKKWLDAQKKS